MTPKEKAYELLSKFNYSYNCSKEEFILYKTLEELKRCALISVDEIMDSLEKNGSWNAQYWEDVKTEIEKL
jgi:hypothetical protein